MRTTATDARPVFKPESVETTAWAVALCDENAIARRLCASGASAQGASDDAITGLPLPKPWFVRTAKRSLPITSLHVETPRDLTATLDFYRGELRKRGWTENDGAVVASDRAVIAFTTASGPALLRLTRQDDRTIADLSLRRPAAARDGIQPNPGQAKLMLANVRDEAAVVTVNAQTIKLVARAGDSAAIYADEVHKLPDNQKLDLLPGKYKVTLSLGGGAPQNREFEVAAGETWSLLVGPDGVPLPLHLY